MARQRKPAETQARKRNPGHRQLVIAPTAQLPTLEVPPPDYLTELAKQVWAMIAPNLIAMKILRRSDSALFGVFCETFAEYAMAKQELDREGYTYDTSSNHGDMKRVHPLYLVLSRARRDLFTLGASFGLTPTDRYRVLQNIAAGGAGPLTPDPRAKSDDDDGQDDLLERAVLDVEPDSGRPALQNPRPGTVAVLS